MFKSLKYFILLFAHFTANIPIITRIINRGMASLIPSLNFFFGFCITGVSWAVGGVGVVGWVG